MGIATETETRKKRILSWLKKSLIPLVGIAGAIAVFVVVGWVYLRYHEFFQNINDNLKAYGYLGIFVVSLILNATIIIPVSAMAIISSLGVLFLPFAVGIVGGIGAGVGEMTGYVAGRAGRDLLAKNKIYVKVEGWVRRWGMLAVFLLSMFPLLFDIVGIIAGATRMPVWKFFIACWLGRTIIYITVAYFGHFGISFFIKWFG